MLESGSPAKVALLPSSRHDLLLVEPLLLLLVVSHNVSMIQDPNKHKVNAIPQGEF
jgi:hypothetical protein